MACPILADTRLALVNRLREVGVAAPGKDDFPDFDERMARLGQLLLYDPVLSGNRNISCGTCHHHDLASADGLSLGLGEGGEGIGVERKATDGANRVRRRMSRNSPSLFNLGASAFKLLFHDGRVSLDNAFGNGFNTPAEEFLPEGIATVLAAQTLFPLAGEVEMAGSSGENLIASAVSEQFYYGWPLIVKRIRDIPYYEQFFVDAYDNVDSFQDLDISHVANAIGGFVGSEWRSFDSPFDEILKGSAEAMSGQQLAGMDLFVGKANCPACQNDKFPTDHAFHALALPPLGPGRTRRFDLHNRDPGRVNESDDLADFYRFRTPALRNVALTAPYGHNGAFRDLDGIVRHHLYPLVSLDNWTPDGLLLPKVPWVEEADLIIWQDRLEMDRYRRHVDIEPISLTDNEIDALVAFLHALTGGESVDGRLGRPSEVPSGLPVD